MREFANQFHREYAFDIDNMVEYMVFSPWDAQQVE